jgi:hypothetical protein
MSNKKKFSSSKRKRELERELFIDPGNLDINPVEFQYACASPAVAVRFLHCKSNSLLPLK